MAGETAGWLSTARTLFASFGDVVADVTLYQRTGSKTYDSDTGKNVPDINQVSGLKMVQINLSRAKFESYFGADEVGQSEVAAYILPTSDGEVPGIGDELIDDDTSEKFRIEKMRPDSAGLGAYYTVVLTKVQ